MHSKCIRACNICSTHAFVPEMRAHFMCPCLQYMHTQCSHSNALRLYVHKNVCVCVCIYIHVNSYMSSVNQDEVERMAQALQEREAEIESLNKELDSRASAGGRTAARHTSMEGVESGANEAAQHTEEVARLTIERLEKNNKRKNEMIQKYQEQLRQAREEYMAQKEIDSEMIQSLHEQLVRKRDENIHNLRARAHPGSYGSLSGPAVADADAVFAEKDALIDALNRELQTMKGKSVDLDRQITDLEGHVREKQSEIDALTIELRKAEEKKPSQVLETLVFKLKRQLKEKDRKQQEEMKNEIDKLREEMLEKAKSQLQQQQPHHSVGRHAQGSSAVDAQVEEEAARLKMQIKALEDKLKLRKTETDKVKEELKQEKDAKDKLKEQWKEMEERLRKQGDDLKRAKTKAKEAKESLKALEGENKRISDLEQRVKEAEKGAMAAATQPGRRGEEASGPKDQFKMEAAARCVHVLLHIVYVCMYMCLAGRRGEEVSGPRDQFSKTVNVFM
jgi:chromosome segregation ATPase